LRSVKEVLRSWQKQATETSIPVTIIDIDSGVEWRECILCQRQYCAFCLQPFYESEWHEAGPGSTCYLEALIADVRAELSVRKMELQVKKAVLYMSRIDKEGLCDFYDYYRSVQKESGSNRCQDTDNDDDDKEEEEAEQEEDNEHHDDGHGD
jgi:hypothetical protein